MIDGLKPYPHDRDSGVIWLGRVPEHWHVHRARYLVREIDLRSKTGAETHLSMSQKHGLVPSSEMQEQRLVSESYVGAKLCQVGDLVLNRLKAHLGVFARAEQPGLVSPDYTVLRGISVNVSMSFLEYLLRSTACRGELRTRAKGLVEGFWRLYTDDFYDIKLPVPPITEQRGIVRFLNHVDRRIRRYIRAKKKLIALLNEQKQAIIHRAVTRGLDPSVRVRPSGVVWLGDVPDHWRVQRLKRVSVIQTGITLGKKYQNATLIERPYLRVANVQASRLDLKQVTSVRVPHDEARRSTLQPRDVLMTEGGDIDKLGRGCVWTEEIPDCLHQNHIFAVRPRISALLPEFLVALMGSSYGRTYFQTTAKQTTNLAATNSTTLGNFPLPLPDINEQRALLDHIQQYSAPLDATIRDASDELSLLIEYRTRLAADVVIGKLDVREAAARLLEAVEDDELAGDADATEDGDDDAEGEEVIGEEAEP